MFNETTDYQTFTTIDTSAKERKRLGVGDIWANEAMCKKCKDVIRSKNRHDMVWCKCHEIFVDGGSWYARRGGNIKLIEDRLINYNDIQHG